MDVDSLIREADPARGLVVPEVDPRDIRRLRRGPTRPRRRPVDALVAGVAVAVAVAVAAVVLLAGGQPHAALPASGRAAIPAAARPLVRILGVFRRPQTAADKAIESNLGSVTLESALVRLATVTPWGQQVVLAPQRTPHEDTVGVLLSGNPGARYGGYFGITARAIEAGDAALMLAPLPHTQGEVSLFMVVPDGVAKVAFLLAPKGLSGSLSGWTSYAPLKSRTVTVRVHNNVAAVQLPYYCCRGFPMTRWYAADGRVIKMTNSSPTHIPYASAARPTVLDALRANGIGNVRFGASPTHVRTTIDSLLHQDGGAYDAGGTCGLDHQITWIDQGTASGQPSLTVYFRHSAFVGYQVGEPAAPRYPSGGWALATTRGLKVGDKLARGRRLYGTAFSLSSAQGGTWKLRASGGPIDGYAWGTARYGDVSWQSVVATIDAGDVGCPAIAP
jgi:hypothetical protein